jgi:hypothetical protein
MILRGKPGLPRSLGTTRQLNVLRNRWKRIDGWLTPKEAALLARVVATVRKPVVEVGSYKGRSTVMMAGWVDGVRIYAIDPHEGIVGEAGKEERYEPTWDAFLANVQNAGASDIIVPIRKKSVEVEWNQEIGLLFVDGLHDYESVRRDFEHFEKWVSEWVAFHDYAAARGVTKYVDELVGSEKWTPHGLAGNLFVLKRR